MPCNHRPRNVPELRPGLFWSASLILLAGTWAPSSPASPAPADTAAVAAAADTAGAPLVLVDRLLAIVDEEPILMSDLEREVALYQLERRQEGQPVDEDEEAIREEVLERLVESKLIIAAAKQADIKVEDEEVQRDVEENISQLVRHFGSQATLERELRQNGMTLDDYRARSAAQLRDRHYMSAVIRSFVRPKVEVLENEIDEYYRAHAHELPATPDSVVLGGILVAVQPAPDVQREVQRKLGEALKALGEGRAFADVARVWSEDPNARRGGVLGVVKAGDLFDRNLENAVFSLQVGQVSPPIVTDRGVHLVRLDAVTDEGRAISQIFLPVKITAADVEAARREAGEVRARLAAGEAFAKVASEASDDPTSSGQGGHLGGFRVNALTPLFQEALQGLDAGQVTEPFLTPAGFYILNVKERLPGRPLTYAEVKDSLRRAIESQKLEAELERYVDGLRRRFFVDMKL